MVLIADSGSTKTEWKLVENTGRTLVSITTEGLNPYFLTAAQISYIIEEKVLPNITSVEKIFFYGAGCGPLVKALQVKSAIDTVIPTRTGAEVATDILAAARSLLQYHPGIACILGTGANSCVYTGKEIIEGAPSMGYMFSDWGSGAVISRDFLAILLQEKLPAYIKEDFEATYKLTRVQILEGVYNNPIANKFMASFAPFVLRYAEEDIVKEIILENFRNFYAYYVLRYKESKVVRSVSLVGSVAYHFSKYLAEVGHELDIQIDKILQHPMEGLVHFHCEAKEKFTIL